MTEKQIDPRDAEIARLREALVDVGPYFIRDCARLVGYGDSALPDDVMRGLIVSIKGRDAEIARLREDKWRLDWCESIAAKYPRLENDGLTPMTRKSIDEAMAEWAALAAPKAEPCQSRALDGEHCPDCKGGAR